MGCTIIVEMIYGEDFNPVFLANLTKPTKSGYELFFEFQLVSTIFDGNTCGVEFLGPDVF
jgi:hypothetical protein